MAVIATIQDKSHNTAPGWLRMLHPKSLMLSWCSVDTVLTLSWHWFLYVAILPVSILIIDVVINLTMSKSHNSAIWVLMMLHTISWIDCWSIADTLLMPYFGEPTLTLTIVANGTWHCEKRPTRYNSLYSSVLFIYRITSVHWLLCHQVDTAPGLSGFPITMLSRIDAEALIMSKFRSTACRFYKMQHPQMFTLSWRSVDALLKLCWLSGNGILKLCWHSDDFHISLFRQTVQSYCLYSLWML